MLKARATTLATFAAFHVPAALVAAAYAYLRLTTNTQYVHATFEQLYALTAPLPFGHRVLIPLLSRPLHAIDITVPDCFLFFEFASTWLLLAVLRRLFETQMPRAWATTAAFVFMLLLPCPFLLHREWPTLFYPYDTPAMVFIAAGLWCAIREFDGLSCACVVLAAANRESALLIPILSMALQRGTRPRVRWLGVAGLQVVLFVVVRSIVALALPDNPAPYGGALAWMRDDRPRIEGNLEWMSWFSNDLVLLATLGFLPVAYVALWRRLDVRLHGVAATAAAYFIALMFVANPYEPRVFGEVLVMLGFGVGVGIFRALETRGGSVPG